MIPARGCRHIRFHRLPSFRSPHVREKTVRDALQFAVAHARSAGESDDLYLVGLGGYDQWIRSLETGKADGYGMAYNTVCYLESRQAAVDFLKEAKGRLDEGLGPLFDEAISGYEKVAENLQKVADVFPFFDRKPEHIQDETRRNAAIDALKAARKAEEAGLTALEQVAGEL